MNDFRRRYQGAQGLFWIRRVNHPAGAVVALLLLPTRMTPNMVTMAGLTVHVVTAMVLATLSTPVPPVTWLSVMVLWQLAFSLDCADGQLARARRSSSPFGAWLDQLVDVVTHAILYTALTTYVVRALAMDGLSAALFASIVISLSMLQLLTTWGRAEILGTEPAIRQPSPLLVLMMHGKHVLDYGFYLFVAALLLPWPAALLVFLVAYASISGLAVVAQLGLNWRRYITDARRSPVLAVPARPETADDPSTSDKGG